METPEEIATREAKEAADAKLAEEAAQKALEAEEDVITIGDDAPPKVEDSSVIRKMRQVHKDIKDENRELKKKLEKQTTTDDLGAKPTLEGCDYDAAKYSAALGQWYEKKEVVSKRQIETDLKQKTQDEEWQKKLGVYGEKRAALNVPDYDDAEESVHETFSDTQKGLIIQGADNPAVVIYALGKNSERAKKLAAITDPVKFVAEMSRLETQMKVTKKKVETKPEGKIVGSGPIISGDSALEKLREEAAESGDYTKIDAYRRQQKMK